MAQNEGNEILRWHSTVSDCWNTLQPCGTEWFVFFNSQERFTHILGIEENKMRISVGNYIIVCFLLSATPKRGLDPQWSGLAMVFFNQKYENIWIKLKNIKIIKTMTWFVFPCHPCLKTKHSGESHGGSSEKALDPAILNPRAAVSFSTLAMHDIGKARFAM